jgi:hypothetical protein
MLQISEQKQSLPELSQRTKAVSAKQTSATIKTTHKKAHPSLKGWMGKVCRDNHCCRQL